ncbi:MAG: cytochrome C oxidase subunit IV family protein [Chthoniobacterales bacterium]
MTSTQSNRPSRRSLFIIYVALIILLVITAVGAYLPVGLWGHDALAFGVAVAKALLIVFFFQELYYDKGLVRLFAFAGLTWLFILFLLTFSDYMTRS